MTPPRGGSTAASSAGGRAGQGGRGGKENMSTVKQKIGGQDMTWNRDPEIMKHLNGQPRETFPIIAMHQFRPPTASEKRAVAFQLRIQERIRKHSLYMWAGEEARINKSGISKQQRFNPFTDQESYSARFKPVRRRMPRFAAGQYSLKWFPRELWSTVDPKTFSARKLPGESAQQRQEVEEVEDGSSDEEAQSGDEEDEEGAPRRRNAGYSDDEPEEDPDENFEDDEEMLAGDYDAEAYFDNGEDDDAVDVGDDAGQGGEEGGYYE